MDDLSSFFRKIIRTKWASPLAIRKRIHVTKRVEGSHVKAADSALRTAAKQIQENPGGVILELVNDVEMTDLEKVLSNRFKRIGINRMDILIVENGVLKKVLRYKKVPPGGGCQQSGPAARGEQGAKESPPLD